MIEQAYDLNLIPGGVPIIVNVSQADAGTRTLKFNVFNRNELYTIPSDVKAEVVGTKQDHHCFINECMMSGSVVSVLVTGQMTAVQGDVTCKIRFIKDGTSNVLGSAIFILRVDTAALPEDADLSASDIPMIEEVLALAPELREKMLLKFGAMLKMQHLRRKQQRLQKQMRLNHKRRLSLRRIMH